MSLQSIVYDWAERNGREPVQRNDDITFAAAGWTIRVVVKQKPANGYAFYVRVAQRLPSSHWCGTAADVEEVLERIASKLEAQQLAEVLE